MNKTAIKNFAIWARNKLIADIVYQAGLLGVTEKGIAQPLPQSTNEVQFFDIGTKDYMTVRGKAIRQRNAFVAAIKAKQADTDYASAFRFVVEKVAYTWFNRLIAIRFMEVNDYLSGRVRVLSSENPGKAEPDMVTRPFDTDLSFSAQEQDEIMLMKDENKLDELFRMLFIKQCQKLHEVLPGLFDPQGIERVDSYLELLLTISFTDKDGVLWHLVHDIDEDDFNVEKEGQVEIIGWMYQYYNTEPKDQVFANLKKNIKISKDSIPAATQLFTPDWIVRYMVENSLGRLWVEGHPNEKLKKSWKYYLEEAEQEPQVQVQLAEIRKEYAALRPEEIKVIDPCMGSGHILVYLFDVLMQVYESQGWTQREAAQSIVQNNLYGLDIDDRAAQLAYFAVMMKARQYDRRFLARGIVPHVYSIQESNSVNREHIKLFGNGISLLEKNNAINQLNEMLDVLRDAKEYGSILAMPELDWELLLRYTAGIDDSAQLTLESVGAEETLAQVRALVEQAQVMAQKYHAVTTNPPYMGASNMNPRLNQFIKDYYPDYKSDFFSAFMIRCSAMTLPEGYCGFFTPYVWMFIQSYEKLRQYLYNQCTIETLIQFEYSAFEEATVPVCTLAFRNSHVAIKKGCYLRLVDFRGGMEVQRQKTLEAIANHSCGFYYEQTTDNFSKIPGAPVAYWASNAILEDYTKGVRLKEDGDTRQGMATSDNNRFLRLWFEVPYGNISLHSPNAIEAVKTFKKWFPYNKGGDFRKWYGNEEYVINYENDGKEVKDYAVSLYNSVTRTIKSISEYFKPSISWSKISSGSIAFRYYPTGFIFDVAGCCIFYKDENTMVYHFAFLNSKVAKSILTMISPTLNYEAGHIASLPIIRNREKEDIIHNCIKQLIAISKNDWDSFETSWDFKYHPLLINCIDKGIELLAGMKISQEKWIKILMAGEACFTAIRYYIKKGETTNNQEQGDKYEGVFARLHKSDPRIQDMKERLGEDLEMIIDGNDILLRRYSSRSVPVFCTYGFYKEDAEIIDCTPLNDLDYRLTLRISPSDKLFDSFLDSSDQQGGTKISPWGMGFSIELLQSRIGQALSTQKIEYIPSKIDYSFDYRKEFFINPTPDYPELRYKDSRYSYQKEYRIILPQMHLKEQDFYTVSYAPLGERSAHTFEGAMHFDFEVEGHKRKSLLLCDCFKDWELICNDRFAQLKAKEEELNRIFIDIYGLQDELTPEVADRDVTVRKADLGRDIRSLLSYAVGCMLGRYSLDVDGLAYAGGEWDASKYKTYLPDSDNCLPITDEPYFEDDIVGRFVSFIRTVYGEETLEENLDFIAKALGNKGNTSREVIRNYFLNDFIKDHIKIYQKRPIYWLFDSGKQNGFKALVYMHRWNADTVGNLRVEYLHRMQRVYEKEIERMQDIIDNSRDKREVNQASKRREKLVKQLKEARNYDAKIAHVALSRVEIDLDDGVRVNYEKVQKGQDGKSLGILAKI